jgi:hypothetical protein
MSTPLSESRRRRVHSAGERVVLAIAVATPCGVGSLTIRLLAQHLGVKPMAIRARLLTDTELSLRFGPWISPEAELPYPLYVAARRDATAPSHRQRGRQWHPTAAVTCRGQ